MSYASDLKRSLDELDPIGWGAPKYDSYLVTTCHRLRRKALGDFSVEDLRIMIGHSIGLRWLVPLAVEALEAEPLASGDLYPGDLLAAVLRIRLDFWADEPQLLERTKAVLQRIPEVPDELKDAIISFRKSAG